MLMNTTNLSKGWFTLMSTSVEWSITMEHYIQYPKAFKQGRRPEYSCTPCCEQYMYKNLFLCACVSFSTCTHSQVFPEGTGYECLRVTVWSP